MKALHYIQYFLFLAINWNPRIAAYIVYHEVKGEKKYGIQTTGINELKSVKAAGIDITHATIYMPVIYPLIEEAFEHLPAKRNHFLDMGCGKGRVLCVAADKGFRRVTGIDFSKPLCFDAEDNMQIALNKNKLVSFEVINDDVRNYTIPNDVDCIFFFNPFDETIMKVVLKNILLSLKENERKLTIIYANPLHKELFTNAGFIETFYRKKLTYLELSVLENRSI